MVNVVKRKRRWERDVIQNDREARKLKALLVNRMRLDEQINALDESAAKSNRAYSGDDDPVSRAVVSLFNQGGGSGLDPAKQARRVRQESAERPGGCSDGGSNSSPCSRSRLAPQNP